MNKAQAYHICRSASAIANVDNFAREIRKLQREKRLSWQKAVEELLKT